MLSFRNNWNIVSYLSTDIFRRKKKKSPNLYRILYDIDVSGWVVGFCTCHSSTNPTKLTLESLTESGESRVGHAVPNGCCSALQWSLRKGYAVRCTQHSLSPQVTKWHILGAEPVYANNMCYFCSVLSWIIRNTFFCWTALSYGREI